MWFDKKVQDVRSKSGEEKEKKEMRTERQYASFTLWLTQKIQFLVSQNSLGR